jgi:hypothetical protein
MTIYAGAVGVLVTLATGQSLEHATVIEIHALLPDGTAAVWEAAESETTAGSIEYTTDDGDLVIPGYYSLSAYIEWGESSAHLGESCSLLVEPVPSVPATTWTYSSDFTTTRDQIRVMVGDVDSTDPLLNDSEIAQAYALEGSVLDGAILAAQWAAAKMARDPDTNFDGISTKRSQRHAMMLQTITRLEARRARGSLDFTPPSSSEISQVRDVYVGLPVEHQFGETKSPTWDVLDDEVLSS